jgi:hypothetical protein
LTPIVFSDARDLKENVNLYINQYSWINAIGGNALPKFIYAA